MRAIVFANGSLNQPETVLELLQADDLLISANGGTRHCLALGLTPNLVVGDLDSLTQADLQALQASGAEIISYPARKDFTDLELALSHAQERGADEILVLAALGLRWDQTLANLLLPASRRLRGVRISLVDGSQEILLIRSGQGLELRGRPGDTVSLIPLGGDAHGVTTQGLEYPLESESLYFGGTRGISNVLVGETAHVLLKEGLLLCVTIHI